MENVKTKHHLMTFHAFDTAESLTNAIKDEHNCFMTENTVMPQTLNSTNYTTRTASDRQTCQPLGAPIFRALDIPIKRRVTERTNSVPGNEKRNKLDGSILAASVDKSLTSAVFCLLSWSIDIKYVSPHVAQNSTYAHCTL